MLLNRPLLQFSLLKYIEYYIHKRSNKNIKYTITPNSLTK
jgi:hypothetical protein